MPTTAGLGVRTVADIVQLITHCDTQTANAAEKAICKSQENIATLAKAIGIPIAGVAIDGSVIVAQKAGVRQDPSGMTLTPGALLSSRTLGDAQRFCHAAIQGSRSKGAHINRGIATSLGIAMAGPGANLGSAAGIAKGNSMRG